jgi:hypothetical protein
MKDIVDSACNPMTLRVHESIRCMPLDQVMYITTCFDRGNSNIGIAL